MSEIFIKKDLPSLIKHTKRGMSKEKKEELINGKRFCKECGITTIGFNEYLRHLLDKHPDKLEKIAKERQQNDQ